VRRRRLFVATEASADLFEAKGWLLQAGSGKAARARYKALFDSVAVLVEHPTRYRRWPDEPTRRVMVVGGYRVIYRVDPDTGDDATAGDVTVLAVFGPGEP
jgi:plasmid stabilization system protein ParE